MGKSLDDYQRKRDFTTTPEPPARRADEPGAGRRPVFVVHRHEASRLHYDLRLEMDGVLRSWAVPKGFSYDPADKHLAVRTEDHPLEYEHFDGVIPVGQYGAGSMTIWDRGRYEVLIAEDGPQAVEQGELKLVLHGRKLRGEWHMVRTRGEDDHWLLFKSKDHYAGVGRDSALGIDLAGAPERPLPRTVRRMHAARETTPFSDSDWAFEVEFAGLRVLAEKQGERVRWRGFGRRLPQLEAALGTLRAETALVDGVLVALDPGGRPSRACLDALLAGRGPADDGALCLYVFDCLYYDEFDLRPLPLIDRKSALRAILPLEGDAARRLLYVDHVPADGEELALVAAEAALPGLVAKRLASAYAAGPSEDWARIGFEGTSAPPEDDRSRPLKDVLQQSRPAAARAPGARSRVRYTNLEKVFWPAEGFTKGDLLGWYERVADVLLPYLRERPVHMNRFPDGIEGKSFYQRHATETTADWLTTELIDSESKGEPQRYIICNDRDTLLYLANQGSIDLHPWMSRRGTPESPDWAVIDIDPKTAPFADVIAVAGAVGRVLEAIGLRACLKTSGKTGLHVFIPLEPGYGYEQSRMFCEGVARAVVRERPDIATVERNPNRREGKVYVDFLQNGKGQTVVPPYVPRPVPGGQVSAPLHWDELDAGLHPSRFTIQTVGARIERDGDLFAPVLADPQDLLPAIERLAAYVRD